MSTVASLFAQAASTDDFIPVDGPSVDWRGLLPLIILMVGALLMLTFSSILRGKAPRSVYAVVTVAIASAAAISAIPVAANSTSA